jgi:hypothetical protein
VFQHWLDWVGVLVPVCRIRPWSLIACANLRMCQCLGLLWQIFLLLSIWLELWHAPTLPCIVRDVDCTISGFVL